MVWRKTRAAFERDQGQRNRRSLKSMAQSRVPTGVLAYLGRRAVGWCSVAPREQFSFLERSRILKPVDQQPVWSISCFFIAREYRGRGISTALLSAAAEYAGSRGARIVEGYPVETNSKQPDVFVWTGLNSAFEKAGFEEVVRRSRTRPVMRKIVEC